MAKFAGLRTQVLGCSVDHVPCLTAWAESLGGVNFPLLSDFWPHGEMARKFGVLRAEGFTERAIFILDRNGIIRYIDIHDIGDQPSNEVLLDELRRIDPEAAAAAPLEPEPVELPTGGVVMYCSSWCPDCRNAQKWLAENGIEYRQVDVNDVVGAAQQVRNWADGKLVTPTFDIDGTIVVNFQEDRLLELIGQR
jgi:glutaredoxin